MRHLTRVVPERSQDFGVFTTQRSIGKMSEFQSRNYPIKEDMDFQRRSWTVERAGWLILGVVMVAALVGLFGYGPVSKAHLNGNDLKLSYERFQRSTKLATYVFRLGGGS